MAAAQPKQATTELALRRSRRARRRAMARSVRAMPGRRTRWPASSGPAGQSSSAPGSAWTRWLARASMMEAAKPCSASSTAGPRTSCESQAAVAPVEREPAVDGARHRHAADVLAQGHHRHALGAHACGVRAGTGTADRQQRLGRGVGRGHHGEDVAAEAAQVGADDRHHCSRGHCGVGRRAAAGEHAQARRCGQLVGRRHHAAQPGPGAEGREREGHGQGETTTTERSTSPRCIRAKASSTSSDPDRLADEPVEVEPSVQVEVHEHREVPGREAVAVPARLQRAAPAEELDHGQVDAHVGRRHADLDQRPGQVARHEGLFHHLRVPHRLDADVGTVAIREGLDRRDRVGRAGVDGVRRAE